MPSEPSKKTIKFTKTITYTPFGYRAPAFGENDQLRFNGEWLDTLTGQYFLGLGYRAFNPVMMRFNTPDKISPFGAGGLNSYTYCLNDPVNLSDPEGDSAIGRFFNRIPKYFRSRTHRQLIGYHGTIESSVKSLKNGLDPKFMKITNYGKGFYFSQSMRDAEFHANLQASVNSGEKPVVVGVYAENVEALVEGKDFNYAEKNAMVLQTSAYKKVTIRRGTESELHRRNSYGEFWERKKRQDPFGNDY